jgi:hypothetical protein
MDYFTLEYANRHIPRNRQRGIRHYFKGKSYFDFVGNEYKIKDVIFFERTSIVCPHTDIIFDYEYIQHSFKISTYTPIVERIKYIIKTYSFWEVPNCTIYFGIDTLSLHHQKRAVENYYIDEQLKKEKFISGLPNLFYRG